VTPRLLSIFFAYYVIIFLSISSGGVRFPAVLKVASDA
jgi:hypothetical protein